MSGHTTTITAQIGDKISFATEDGYGVGVVASLPNSENGTYQVAAYNWDTSTVDVAEVTEVSELDLSDLIEDDLEALNEVAEYMEWLRTEPNAVATIS